MENIIPDCVYNHTCDKDVNKNKKIYFNSKSINKDIIDEQPKGKYS